MKKIKYLLLCFTVFLSCERKTYDEIIMVTPEEMQELLATEDVQLIDIRTPKEYQKGYIKGFQNLDYTSDTFYKDLEKLDKSKPVVLYCRSGRRTANCAEKLVEKGFVKIYDLEGGISHWKHKGFELEKNTE